MKLVLKYEEQVKLYTQQLSYPRLFEFVEREFGLQGPGVEISFTDQEGDAIAIASEDDITIIQSYFTGKSYVKLSVKGQKNEKKLGKDEKDGLQLVGNVKAPKDKKTKRDENIKKEQKPKKQQKKDVKKKKAKKPKQKKIDSNSSEIKKLLSVTVAEMVDERLRAMIPCLREQLSIPGQRKAPKQDEHIHEGYECSICFQAPIIGIRYDCPTCDRFTICEVCEQSSEHEHSLLKVRNPIQGGNKEEGKQNNRIDELCKMLLERTDELSLKRQKEEAKKKQENAAEKESTKQAKRYLSQLFGNEPKSFNEFVKAHKKMPLEQIIKEYAMGHGITEDELHARVVDLQCQRLAKKFKKEAGLYRDFVKEHFSFDLEAILKKIYSEGIERKEKKKEKSKSVKVEEEKPKEAVLQKESMGKQEEASIQKKEEVPIEMKEERVEAPVEKQKEQAKPRKESSEVKGSREETLKMMIEFFGKGREDDFIRFIAVNQRYGKENIVQMWADTQSVISP